MTPTQEANLRKAFAEIADRLNLNHSGYVDTGESRMAKWEIEVKDNVNNPPHYGQGKIECIEYIKDFLNEDEYVGYLRGNIAKYLHRWRYKNGLEDLKKAQWYLNELVKTVDKVDPT